MIDLSALPVLHEGGASFEAKRPVVYVSGGGAAGKSANDPYQAVRNGYVAALREAGFETLALSNPGSYARRKDLPGVDLMDAQDRRLHIGIGAAQQFRVCRPLPNVHVFAWEFDVVRTDDLPGDSPFDNQLRMLALADEVFTLCSYSRRILEQLGLNRVRVVPAPVQFGPKQTVRDDGGCSAFARSVMSPAFHLRHNSYLPHDHVFNRPDSRPLPAHPTILRAASVGALFFSEVDPRDPRSNLTALLLGFHGISAAYGEAALLIKLRMPAETSLKEAKLAVAEHLPPLTSIDNDRILFLVDDLDGQEMAHLYAAASCYLTATIAESQNLPLMRAMGHGCLAVSPIHTAMLDYLDVHNSVRIDTHRMSIWSPGYDASHARRPFSVDRASLSQVARAVDQTLRLSPNVRRRLADAGARQIRENYSVATIARLLAGAIGELTACGHGPTP